MQTKVFNTLPNKNYEFWQVVVFPTLTILRNKEPEGSYTVFNFEWLFWSLTFVYEY